MHTQAEEQWTLLSAGADALNVLQLALDSGDFTGVGIAQKGDFGSRFIHLDDLDNERRPTLMAQPARSKNTAICTANKC